MPDKEERQSLDQSRKGEDLDELNEERFADSRPGRLQVAQVEEFRRVTEEMVEILESRRPFLEISPALDPTVRFALEALYEAKTSRDTSTNEFISGLVRSKQLNQALVHLQPILALALRPDFKAGRAMYDRLVADVNQLQADIKNAILVQLPVAKPAAAGKTREEEEDDSPDDAAPDDAAPDDSAPDDERGEEAHESAHGGDSQDPKNRGSWLGGLLKRRKRPRGQVDE